MCAASHHSWHFLVQPSGAAVHSTATRAITEQASLRWFYHYSHGWSSVWWWPPFQLAFGSLPCETQSVMPLACLPLPAVLSCPAAAADYFEAVFPGRHMDRLFTVAYLPVCLLMLGLLIKYNTLPGRPRILTSFAGFVLIMLAIPCVSDNRSRLGCRPEERRQQQAEVGHIDATTPSRVQYVCKIVVVTFTPVSV